MSELLKCPFCGGEAVVNGDAYYWVCCKKCKAETRGFYSKVGAVNLWNKRVGDDQERVVEMANEVDNVMAATTEKETMIVGTFPQIIVTGTAEKPYYQIMYRENEDCEIQLGFGSFYLAYVFQWLKEFFGVTHASAVNPESLRPKGRWVEKYSFGCWHYDCSNCNDGYATEEQDKYKPNYCPNCGAKMMEE